MGNMTLEQAEKWFELTTRYGLPLMLLALAGWLLYRFFCWIKPHAEKLIAYIEKMFESHNALVDTLGNEAVKQTSAMERQARSIELMDNGHRVTHGKLDNVNERLERIEARVGKHLPGDI